MKDDTNIWLNYAQENLAAAQILLESHLYNPCLQNIQQAVEKSLKAVIIEKAIGLRKTHSISELISNLSENNVTINISEEECELLDSIYLPSKYPLGSVLPDFHPDEDICMLCIRLAKRVHEDIKNLIP